MRPYSASGARPLPRVGVASLNGHNAGTPTNQEWPATVRGRAGRWPVQLRFATTHTSNDYVTQQAWRNASLARCPLHPYGGCSFARHGTYARVKPPGTRIPRWYCPEGHCTFSLLADCFAARLSGTLCEVEAVVAQVEQARSLETAANGLRLEIELPGVLRWLRRRVQAIHLTLVLLKGLMPAWFAACDPTLAAFRQRLARDAVLLPLREIAACHLPVLPPPLGFCPPKPSAGDPQGRFQQRAGPDPPAFYT